MAAIYTGDEKVDKMNELAHAAMHAYLIEKGHRKPAGKIVPPEQARPEDISHIARLISSQTGQN